MLDPLLVQLFGREVTDKVAQAGFDSTDSLARVNAEWLAEEAGIAPALARRIIAVAVESVYTTSVKEVPSDQEGPRADQHEAPRADRQEPRSVQEESRTDREEPHSVQEESRTDRHVRRPFRRPLSPLTVPPAAPAGPGSYGGPGSASGSGGLAAAGSPSGDAAFATRPRADAREALSDGGATKTPEPIPDPGGPIGSEGDLDEPILRPRGAPYVDDAGLIFTIGNAVRSGRSAGMTIAVAEEILDPPSPSMEAPEEPSSEGKSNEEPAAPKSTLLQGSLWSFGIWSPETPAPNRTIDRSATREKPEARQGASAKPVPRRRSGDGH